MVRAVFVPESVAVGDIGRRGREFLKTLRARELSPRTAQTYGEAIGQLASFLADKGMPTEVAHVSREHVEEFIADILRRYKPATAHCRYRSLKPFFKWLVEEGEITKSPMQNMKPPKVPQVPLRFPTVDEFQRLIDSIRKDKSFDGIRDLALILFLADTGARRSEVTGMKLDDIDFDHDVVRIMGKGKKARDIPYQAKCSVAINRYVRARERHPMANRPDFWLSSRGALTDSGIQQICRRRGRAVDLGWIHCHVFRHWFADGWLAGGGSEGDLLRIMGWSSRSMLDRYGAGRAVERALAAHRTFSPVERVLR